MTAPAPLFGPYRPPWCRVGGTLVCAMRGAVTVHGLSDAPVPWPYTRGRGRPSLILCGDLARAIRQEANLVVCALFGVTGQTVTKWRRALGVPHATAGTSERMAAAKRGAPRPAHVRAALRKGPAWSADEDEAVRTLRPPESAGATGRSLPAVYSRRRRLGLPDGRAGRSIRHRGGAGRATNIGP